MSRLTPIFNPGNGKSYIKSGSLYYSEGKQSFITTSGERTTYPSGAHEFTPILYDSSCSMFSFCVMCCRSLFFLFCPLFCLSFDLRLLNTHVVSLHFSYNFQPGATKEISRHSSQLLHVLKIILSITGSGFQSCVWTCNRWQYDWNKYLQ